MHPEQLGKYKILSKIGQGAMGEVFKAHDPLLNRHVAIKTMSAGMGADDELRQRFLREAQSAALLSHPNIITVYDLGEAEGRIFMAMELLEGQDLKVAMAAQGLPSLERKVSVMEQIADGLSYAHAKGVVHRDLKPANIHLLPGGGVKVMDFGLARLASSEMTRVGTIMGTPNYMSPEQVRGEKADSRSDVFALGALFYELLGGRKPFEADTLPAILFQVMQAQPEPLAARSGGLPPALCEVVEKALRKDPAERYQNAGELRDAVRKVQAALFPKERPSPPARAAVAVRPPPPARERPAEVRAPPSVPAVPSVPPVPPPPSPPTVEAAPWEPPPTAPGDDTLRPSPAATPSTMAWTGSPLRLAVYVGAALGLGLVATAAVALAIVRSARERPPSPAAGVERAAIPPAIPPASAGSGPAAPSPGHSTPVDAAQETAIRRVIADYERALKARDATLFRAVKPNLSGSEERALRGIATEHIRVGLVSLQVSGDSAAATVSREDVRNGRAVSFRQRLLLVKQDGHWVIDQIGP